MINNILNEVGNALDDKDAEIERLRSDKELLEAGVREMANMIDDLRARNAKLVAVLDDAVQTMERHFWDEEVPLSEWSRLRDRCRAALAKAEGK